MIKIVTCLLFLEATNLAVQSLHHNRSTLELVHVLFRHGDRTPERDYLYPNDPHINASYHPFGYGQLTNAGKQKQYMLGKALRKRYRTFLGTYTVDTVDARSTDYRRTKMSLQLVLASLFPPENEQIWEKSLRWQPVPFSYWPQRDDHVLGDPYRNCKRYKQLYLDFGKSPEAEKMLRNHSETTKYVSKHAGIEISSKYIAEVYFTLTTELENGRKPPDWTKPVYPHSLKNFAQLEYVLDVATPQLKRLASGFWLKKMITDTSQKINNTLPEGRKMFVYSAHEFNIAFLMQLLGIYYPHVPPYGAYFLVEIHNIKGVRGVKIFYQDYQTGKPRRMKLPKCQYFCRFERFVKLYKDYLPKTEKECDIED